MKHQNSIYRNFINTLMKLRRDSLILKESLNKNILVINIDDTQITFNTTQMCWKVISINEELNFESWNPEITKVIEFLDNFKEYQILISIQDFEDQSMEFLSKLDAVLLMSKFLQILDLLKYPENNIIPLPKINFFTTKDNNFGIIYNFNNLNFDIIDYNVNNVWEQMPDNFVQEVLKISTYTEISKALNDCYIKQKVHVHL